MKKYVCTLGTLLPLLLAAPAMAGSDDEYDYPYPSYEDFFQYHPFHFQISGGGTITQRSAANDLKNGFNVGAGLTWYPTSNLPFGIRVDGVYSKFDARDSFLGAAQAQLQTPINNGTVKMWGGDIDAEIDFRLGPRVKAYLLAGGGWYDQQVTYRYSQAVPATLCDWWGNCYPGYANQNTVVSRNTTGMHFSKNAGFGMEFGLSQKVSFFVEARYMRLDPGIKRMDFIPIRAGLRF